MGHKKIGNGWKLSYTYIHDMTIKVIDGNINASRLLNYNCSTTITYTKTPRTNYLHKTPLFLGQ